MSSEVGSKSRKPRNNASKAGYRGSGILAKTKKEEIPSSVKGVKIIIGDVDYTPLKLLHERSAKTQGNSNSASGSIRAEEVEFKDASGSMLSASKNSFRMDISQLSTRESEAGDVSDMDSEIENAEVAKDATVSTDAPVTPGVVEEEIVKKKKLYTEQQLDELLTVELQETDTITLFHIPGVSVWAEDVEIHEAAVSLNDKYKKFLEERSTKDIYSSRNSQTFNMPTKDKEISAVPPVSKNNGVSASIWDIYDSYELDDNQEGTSKNGTHSVAVGDDDEIETKEAEESINLLEKADNDSKSNLLKSETFLHALKIVERAITQNDLHEQQALYRNNEKIANRTEGNPNDSLGVYQPEMSSFSEKSEIASSNPALSFLWTFSCEETKGRNVSGMDWNKTNSDILATSYGEFDFGNDSTGLIALWTLKNPGYPERLIECKYGVTCIDFSTSNPHLLAAGFSNGSIAIYDIRSGSKPLLESVYSTGKHSECVMDIKWVVNGDEHSSHHLTTISTDGNVKQWNMKKGLIPINIMTLKRVSNQAQILGATHGDGVVSRTGCGLCFDFLIGDSSQYIAGTEDGIIHKCSVSYNDQVLESYFGHLGPVYKTKCSPFFNDAFLSCSADWTIRLWNQKSPKPVYTFQSGLDYITDISWSPFNSTVFGSVARDGRVEVWDLSKNTLDPLVKMDNSSKSYSSVLFGRNAPILLTGAADGSIDVHRINGIENNTNIARDVQIKLLRDKMAEEEMK